MRGQREQLGGAAGKGFQAGGQEQHHFADRGPQSPIGEPSPSYGDIEITKDLVACGKLLGIEVLDHLVIGSGQRYVGMNENGQGFS